MNIRKVFIFSVGPIGTALLGFITLPIVAWFFSPEDVGRLTMLQVSISFSLLLFSLGLDQAYVREYHEVKDKSSLLKAVFLPGFLILLLFSFLSIFSPLSLSFILFGDDSLRISILFYSVIFLSFFSRFLSLILRMQERGFAYSTSQILPKIVFLFTLLIYIFFNAESIFYNLILANFISVFTVFLIYAWNTRRDWIAAFSAAVDRSMQLYMIRYAIPLIGSGVAFWGLTAMDRFFLRSLSNFEELGIYSISVSFAGAALVLQSIFSTVWAPTVYKWTVDGVNVKKIEEIMRYVTLIVVIIWSTAGMFSWLIYYILPPRYAAVQHILLAAMAYPLLYTLSEATGIGVGIKRKTGFLLLAAIFALIVNAILNWALIPFYGASGAAIGSAIAFFVFFVIKTESSAALWMRFDAKKMYSIVSLITGLSIALNIWVVDQFIIVFLYLLLFLTVIFLFFTEVKDIFLLSRNFIFCKFFKGFFH